MWVFGYGSLVWKVDFPYEQKLIGYIKGFNRRFYQASIDHRGTPDKPGRVVTLIPSSDPEDKVWGVAYQIPDDESTIGGLNTREKQFSQMFLPFHSDTGAPPISCLTYIANPKGPLFLGPAIIPEIVSQISQCSGPSGPNSEYILQLASWHRHNLPDIDDPHLFQLETALKEKLSLTGSPSPGSCVGGSVSSL